MVVKQAAVAMVTHRTFDIQTVYKHDFQITPGFKLPGVLFISRYCLFLLHLAIMFLPLAAEEQAKEPEVAEKPIKNQQFDLELISSAFGKFHIEDPQNQSWSLVEEGARVAYKGLTWQAESLRYHHQLFDFYKTALVDRMELGAAKKSWCIVDSSETQMELIPVRALMRARSMHLQGQVDNDALFYKLQLNVCDKIKGRMRFRDKQWYPFNLSAESLLVSAVIKKNNKALTEPSLQYFLLKGLSRCDLAQQEPKRSVSMLADELQIDFDPAGFAHRFELRGSRTEPATLRVIEGQECKTYTGSTLQVQLDTAGTLASLKCSSDVRFRNKVISGDFKACVEEHAD